MKLILAAILIALFAGIAEWFAPWWSIAIVASLAAVAMKLRPGIAFLSGLFGIALLWLSFVLWRDIPNGHILSERLAKLFKLPDYRLFILVSVLIGALVGGLSAWAGAQLRLAFTRSRP